MELVFKFKIEVQIKKISKTIGLSGSQKIFFLFQNLAKIAAHLIPAL